MGIAAQIPMGNKQAASGLMPSRWRFPRPQKGINATFLQRLLLVFRDNRGTNYTRKRATAVAAGEAGLAPTSTTKDI
jgi:hypothetical protein